MLKTIILLTGSTSQQLALSELLRAHHPALAFRGAVTLEDLLAIEPEVLRDARLIAFTSGVIVPGSILEAIGHGAYNFHPGPPSYPGWAPAHFALYGGAKIFGATGHLMMEAVDCGPIVGVESFIIPDGISVRGLEQMAFVRLAHLFWRMSREIAREPGPLPTLPVSWSGTKSSRRSYQEICEIRPGISVAELKRRVRAFHDDFRAIPLTVSLHGFRFQLAEIDEDTSEAPCAVETPSAA
jgi:methionyl-tRNA formyltransferase